MIQAVDSERQVTAEQQRRAEGGFLLAPPPPPSSSSRPASWRSRAAGPNEACRRGEMCTHMSPTPWQTWEPQSLNAPSSGSSQRRSGLGGGKHSHNSKRRRKGRGVKEPGPFKRYPSAPQLTSPPQDVLPKLLCSSTFSIQCQTGPQWL